MAKHKTDGLLRPDKKEYVCVGAESGDRLYVGVESGEYREATAYAV